MKTSADKQRYAAPNRTLVSCQRGLSLVELMISITIGLLILVALTTLFVNQSKTRTELDKSNRMIDNGRYALEMLSENLRMAGYYGELDTSAGIPAIPGALPDPCTTDAAVISTALQLAIQGYDAAVQSSNIANPPCSFTYAAGSELSLKPGSDILVMRRASTAPPIVAGAALAGTHYLQVSLCQYDNPAVPYILSTTPADFTLRTTGCTPATTLWSSATTYALNTAVDYNGISYVSLANSNLNNTPLTTIGTWWNTAGSSIRANLRNFMVQVYFVSPNNSPSDGIPTLKRLELDPTDHIFKTTPLVEGIEYMQVDYGLDDPTKDTNGDGTVGLDGIPDSYSACSACTPTNWSNVVAVKINILARNTEATPGHSDTKTYTLSGAGTLGGAGTFGPFSDKYKRHVYTQFIRLVNPAGRRD